MSTKLLIPATLQAQVAAAAAAAAKAPQTLFTQTGQPTNNASVAEVSLLTAAGAPAPGPPNIAAAPPVGRQYVLEAFGVLTSPALSGGTVTCRIRVGGAQLTTWTWSPLASQANIPWWVKAVMTVSSTDGGPGAGDGMTVGGAACLFGSAGAVQSPTMAQSPVAVDLSAARSVDLTAQWSNATAGDIIGIASASLVQFN